MKRFTAVLAAAVLVICLAVMPAFAAGLEITGVTPKDGAKGRQPANMAIKLKFSEDMVGDESKDAINTGKITIKNAEILNDLNYRCSKLGLGCLLSACRDSAHCCAGCQ